MTNQENLKKAAAKAAIAFVQYDDIVGVGTGSTTNYFIDELAKIKHKIEGAVASSKATEERLRAHNIPLLDLNSTGTLPIYIDGADEFNSHYQLIKGGGGALTREKIVAAASKKFVCIADYTKSVDILGKSPLPIEVIPMSRSYVARELVKLGGSPVYREGFVTDNGNMILDVQHLNFEDPYKLENQLNNIPGVVENGLFALRLANILLIAEKDGVKEHKREG